MTTTEHTYYKRVNVFELLWFFFELLWLFFELLWLFFELLWLFVPPNPPTLMEQLEILVEQLERSSIKFPSKFGGIKNQNPRKQWLTGV